MTGNVGQDTKTLQMLFFIFGRSHAGRTTIYKSWCIESGVNAKREHPGMDNTKAGKFFDPYMGSKTA